MLDWHTCKRCYPLEIKLLLLLLNRSGQLQKPRRVMKLQNIETKDIILSGQRTTKELIKLLICVFVVCIWH